MNKRIGFILLILGLFNASTEEVYSEFLVSLSNHTENTGEFFSDPIAHGKPKFLGNVYSNSQLPNFENYWNQVTPENAGKWGSVESTRDVMNWTVLDAAYTYAKEHDFYFKFHVLVWGNQQPSWIENLTSSEQLEEIKEWFAAVAARYPDIDAIEVVNEPISDPPNSTGSGGGNYINALGGTGATGFDWIVSAFTLARQYFPDTDLMINEYSVINDANKLNKYKNIIELLKEKNLIDLVGFQAHAFSTTGSTDQMKSNLNKLADTGLPLYVTELDIDGPTDEIQLAKYKEVFPIFWEHHKVQGVTLWGYRPGMWRTEQKAYLINEDGVTERPALIWLKEYVQNTLLANQEVKKNESLKVFPNPLSGKLITVEGLQTTDKVQVFNLQGFMVDTPFVSENQAELSKRLIPGIYILKIYGNKGSFEKRIVVE